jgi:hypothetical protein
MLRNKFWISLALTIPMVVWGHTRVARCWRTCGYQMKGVGKVSSQKLTDLDMREKSEILAGVHITPYGTFELDMHERLPLEAA